MSDSTICPKCGFEFPAMTWYGYEINCKNCGERVIPIVADDNNKRKLQEGYEHKRGFMSDLASAL